MQGCFSLVRLCVEKGAALGQNTNCCCASGVCGKMQWRLPLHRHDIHGHPVGQVECYHSVLPSRCGAVEGIPALVRNSLGVRPVVYKELDTIEFPCPRGAVESCPSLVGGNLNVRSTFDQKLRDGCVAKETRHVERSSTDANVSNKQLPEVGLQLGALTDNSMCPAMCKYSSMSDKRQV